MTNLERWSMINTPLLNPVQSKREYFWLFLIVVLENFIALCIELYNGGVWTSQVCHVVDDGGDGDDVGDVGDAGEDILINNLFLPPGSLL